MPYCSYSILLAEDDPDDCQLFTEALSDLAIKQRPIIIHDGEQLVQYLRDTVILPDLLFLDINMPFKDGLTALQEIKAEEHLRHLPIVMFSTTKDLGTVQKAYQSGASLYACKPSGYTLLVNLLQRILSLDVTGLLAHRTPDRFVMKAE